MTSDAQLLRDYSEAKSQDAFAELVQRHLNLVYSAALRQVRSPQLAEEVSQSVFTDLARAADKLQPDTILTAWLYQVTRRTAIDVVRRESRRQARERLAVEMAAMNTAADWNHIEPLLEDAMEALDETDRAAILLRYFENKSLREVGQSLGTSDDAAQKRVSRAVERLRKFFSQRGIAVGTGGLVVLISANAVQSAPVALAVTTSTAAVLAGTAVHSSAAVIATTMTTLQKTALTIILAATIGTGIYQTKQTSHLRTQVQLLQQEKQSLADQLRQLQDQHDQMSSDLLSLRDENERQKRAQSEALALRNEVARLREANQQLASAQQHAGQTIGNRTGSSDSTNDIQLPKSSWTNAGFTTPENALRTRGWAVLNGDREQFKNSLLLTDGARKVIEDMILKMGAASTDPDKAAALQAAVNNNWGAEEAILMPLMALNQDKSFTGYRIVSEQSPSDDERILEVETQMASAPAEKQTLKFVRIGNDWKVLIDEKFVQTGQ